MVTSGSQRTSSTRRAQTRPTCLKICTFAIRSLAARLSKGDL